MTSIARLIRPSLLALAAASWLAFAAPAPSAPPAWQPAAETDDEAGALIGDLVFHADLLSALDRLCARTPATDWHAPLVRLLEQAFTPELRELSRRLGSDAGTQLVHERGGCRTRGFEAAYEESKDEYRALLGRWRAIGD